MSNFKAVIFDTDGVMVSPWAPFSRHYAKENGLEPNTLEAFFLGDFVDVTLGKLDLLEALENNRALWRWDGDVKDLAQAWFDYENNPNEELVDLIGSFREAGIECYLATNQEQYRTDFIKSEMFPGVFSDIFASYELQTRKPDPEFYQAIINESGIPAAHMIYFDDQEKNVAGAKQAGIAAHVYESPEQIRKLVLENEV